ncbi:unnamed protein product [Microthlaspi erraticum]|uniref:Filament-like plant protein 7 n=1 Tax=Microthlaspi erraticum TaxID=1685480 RepID=A0A6D2JLB7_9BRAS|nr:unnamed protein product [Microthlaspi erraticum]
MEKTVVESNGISSNGEIEKLVADKIELETRLKSLNDKLTSVEAESNKHKTEAQEAIVGWEKTKAESASLKKKLEEALNEKHRSDERSSHTDAGLKECMQQLRFVREEQEQRMHDALSKASQDYERRLTELADTGKRLAEAEGENTQLSKALLAKSKTVEDLNRERDRIEADFKSLVSSLESKEKETVSLRYEVRVLEKELELRNEEREFSRRTAEASHKLHLYNVKKVAKLEEECQRLRILVRKRLPGPAAMSKMRNEVEMLGRRRVNGSTASPMIDSEKISNLSEQICLLEEENKTLRDALSKKVSELQFSRNMYSRTASRLLEFESHHLEPSRSSNVSHEVSLASLSEFDNDEKASCSDSWASALLSELENFKNKKQSGSSLVRTPKASEMKLMDDFAEMEKLAMVDNNRPGSSPMCSSDSISASGPVENESNDNSSKQTDALINDDISKSIRRIVEVIEGVSLKEKKNVSNEIDSEKLSGYTARVLQWKTSELSSVLQRFLQTCYDLLERKADVKKFAEELSSVLEWMVNHCFSLQDVSSMREEIKRDFEWDESPNGSEIDIGTLGQVSEADKLKTEDVVTSLVSIEDKLVKEEAKNKTASDSANEHDKQNMRTELEITAASEKLAECQETILHLGKQLKALTTNSKETPLQPPQETKKPEKRFTTQRSSLLDQMKAEDEDTGGESKDQKLQGGDKTGKGGGSVYNETIEALEHILLSDKKGKGSGAKCFSIVPQKKSGGAKSLWRKLLGKKKKSKSKNLPNPFAI